MDSVQRRVFVAGATGAVGRILCKLLTGEGYDVFGLTRRAERRDFLESMGVSPVVADIYDAPAIDTALRSIRPRIVVHQLTDLPYGLPDDLMLAALVANERIRDLGTKNLIA